MLLAGNCCQANAIDAIRTKKDIIEFIETNCVKQSPNYQARCLGDTLKSSYIDTSGDFYKIDIDGNRKTDIVIAGKGWTDAIMDVDNEYIAYNIGIVGFLMGVPYLVQKTIQLPDYTTGILCRHFRANEYGHSVVRYDTLIFKYHSFIEYQPSSTSLGIKKIDFEVYGHSGSRFYMKIDEDGNALYEDGYYYNERDTVIDLVCKMDENKRKELWDLLTYINAQSLQDNYRFRSFHENTAYLTLYFEDGSTKKIEDYALVGTLGLCAIYNKLFELQQSKGWVKI